MEIEYMNSRSYRIEEAIVYELQPVKHKTGKDFKLQGMIKIQPSNNNQIKVYGCLNCLQPLNGLRCLKVNF